MLFRSRRPRIRALPGRDRRGYRERNPGGDLDLRRRQQPALVPAVTRAWPRPEAKLRQSPKPGTDRVPRTRHPVRHVPTLPSAAIRHPQRDHTPLLVSGYEQVLPRGALFVLLSVGPVLAAGWCTQIFRPNGLVVAQTAVTMWIVLGGAAAARWPPRLSAAHTAVTSGRRSCSSAFPAAETSGTSCAAGASPSGGATPSLGLTRTGCGSPCATRRRPARSHVPPERC